MAALVAQHAVACAVQEVLGGEDPLVVDHALTAAHFGNAQRFLGPPQFSQRDPVERVQQLDVAQEVSMSLKARVRVCR